MSSSGRPADAAAVEGGPWSVRTGGALSRDWASSEADCAATWSALSQGEALWFLGTLAIVRVPGEAVDGRFAVIEFLFPRHASPPLHTHPQDETFIVLEGQLTVQAGRHRFGLDAGATAVVPAGLAHTFRVESDTARVLVLSTPAGIDRLCATAPLLPHRSRCRRPMRPGPAQRPWSKSFAATIKSTSGPRSDRRTEDRSRR
jgi:quercetin dioxygenase-like cupin family protein